MTDLLRMARRDWSLAICGLILTMAPAFAETGQTCMATDAENHAACLSMIGAVRELA